MMKLLKVGAVTYVKNAAEDFLEMKGAAMSELKNIVQSNNLPDGVKAIVSPEVYQLMLKQANHPQLTIPKWVADELQEAIGGANWKGTPYSVILRTDGYLYLFSSLRGKKLSERVYAFCRDNNRLFDAYLNPLTRDLVKVVEG